MHRQRPRPFRVCALNTHPIQYLAPLYARLAARDDIELHVFFCSRQGSDARFVDPGFGHEVVWDTPLLDGYASTFLRNVGGDRGVRGFWSLANPGIVPAISRGDFDAVIVHGHNFATTIAAIVTARARGVPVLMRCETHLGLHRSAMRRTARRVLLRGLYAMCDGFLAMGTLNAEYYRSLGVSDARIFLAPYCVDNVRIADGTREARPRAAAKRAQLGLAEDARVVLFASKFLPRKRPADVLEAALALADAGVPIAVVMAGDGELRGALESWAQLHPRLQVRFVGFQNQTQMPLLFALADVFVLPSENEPWGLIVNEAMAGGLPVIASREVGAVRDLVDDGVTGFSYAAGDVATLTMRLRDVLANDVLRHEMAAGAQRRIATWSYAECVDGYLEAIKASAAQPDTRSD